MEDGTIRETIHEELQKMKKLSLKGRLIYIWDYYKILFVAIIVIIAGIYIGVVLYNNMKISTVISIYLIDCDSSAIDVQGMYDDYAEYIGGLEENQEITIDASVQLNDTEYSSYSVAYQTRFAAVVSAEMVDIILMDANTFENYAGMSYFADLENILPDEDLEMWSHLLIYMDNEEGENGAYGIDLSGASGIEKYGAYSDKVYGGVVANSVRTDICPTFFEWVFL